MATQTASASAGETKSPQAAGTIARQEFGVQQLEVSAETAGGAALAAQARALVEARFVMAMRRPRDLDDVRVKVMREVERPGFAEIAWYRKPIGAGVEGLSVRFFEAAARCFGNLMVTPTTTFEDDRKRIVRVEVIDLETNYSPSLDVTVEKTVERKALNDGRVAISVRKNSKGEITYTVPATEDEMLGKSNSLVSKARRNLLQQIIPGDITDQAKARILAIRRGDAAKDPEGARRKIVDSFAGLNVMPSDLKRWLGHDVAQASPAEITDLRDLYSAIQAGETNWAEALAEKIGGAVDASGDAPPRSSGLDGVAEKLEGTKTAAPPRTAGCTHPDVPPSSLQPGVTIACPKCGEELRGEEPAREPGSDDDTPTPRAAVEALVDKAKTQPPKTGRQGRLQE
jgi:hypothetical protein